MSFYKDAKLATVEANWKRHGLYLALKFVSAALNGLDLHHFETLDLSFQEEFLGAWHQRVPENVQHKEKKEYRDVGWFDQVKNLISA